MKLTYIENNMAQSKMCWQLLPWKECFKCKDLLSDSCIPPRLSRHIMKVFSPTPPGLPTNKAENHTSWNIWNYARTTRWTYARIVKLSISLLPMMMKPAKLKMKELMSLLMTLTKVTMSWNVKFEKMNENKIWEKEKNLRLMIF